MPILARQSYSRLRVLRLQFFLYIFRVFNCHSLFNEAAYLAALRRLHSPFAILDANLKQAKTKIYEKNHLLLQILAVIGRYGPHLMIVMIFVTQNNFLNGPGVSDHLLEFYPGFTGNILFSTVNSMKVTATCASVTV